MNFRFKAVDDFNDDYNANVKKSLFLTADGFYNVIDGDFAANGITNYDIFGFSFYPGFQNTWSKATFEEELDALLNYYATTSNADAGKEVLCIETGNKWTTLENDDYDNFMDISSSSDFNTITPQGQLDFLNYMNTTLVDKGVIGNIYWEPGWISTSTSNPMADLWGHGSSYEDVALFDFDGNALPAWDAFSACKTCNDGIQNGDEIGIDCGGSCPLSCSNSVNENNYTDLSIYPNPAKNNIYITFEGDYSLQIFTLSGQKLYEKQNLKNTSILNIRDLQSGLYILKVNTTQGILVKKLIIQ